MREEAACCAAVEHAVVEAEREVGFGDGHEFFAVPMRDNAACAHAEDERLFGQRDGSRPGEAEGAEVGDGGDGAAGGAGREPTLAREFDEFVIARDEVFERRLIDVAEDGNENTVFGFDGEAEVDGWRMCDLLADETSGGRAIGGEGDAECAERVERGAGFWLARFAMREERIEVDRHSDGR